MNSMAPISTPRVGWPTSNTLGPRSTPAELYRADRAVIEIDEDGNPLAVSDEFGYIDRDGKLRVPMM